MSDKSVPIALRVSTRWCLLCHSLTETDQSLVAVVGNKSFEGYTQTFLYPTDTKRTVIWYQGRREAHGSICSPDCRTPYCCCTSPHTAFLLHNSCIRTLQNASRTLLSMRKLWNLAHCIQPAYADHGPVNINHQIRSFTTSIGSADLTRFSPEMAETLRHIQGLSTELQLVILGFTGSCLGLSLITVLLDTLPLLEKAQTPTPYHRQLSLYPERIYVRRAIIRGQSYISEVGNHMYNSMDEILCASNPDCVILSLDDIGIRDICFKTKGSSSDPVQAPWYQHYDLGNADQTLLVTNNSFVLRHIVPSSRVAVRYLWDCPTVPRIFEHQWYAQDRLVPGTESLFYMRHVDVDQSLTGLTLACDMLTNMSFYAHHLAGDRRSSRSHMAEVERAYGRSLVWIHFPMSPGEKICGFWVLTLHGKLATIAIYTSHARFRSFGPYYEPTSRTGITIKCLHGSRDGYVDTIFYNDLRSKGTERDLRLAISSTQHTTIEVPEHLPWPTSAVPNVCKYTGQTWYHSQASLNGIRSINICKDNTSQICFGMEICYEDRHKEVLGQWRFDQDVETLPNHEDAYAIYFHIRFINGIQCVQDVRFGPHSGLDQPEWVMMAMEGCIVWWFSNSGGVVVHEQDKNAHSSLVLD